MAKFFSDGRTPLGAVYEENERFYYECEICSWSCSGPDEYRLELKADDHDKECRLKEQNGYRTT